MVVGLVVRPVAISGGHIALGALGDRILDVFALVCAFHMNTCTHRHQNGGAYMRKHVRKHVPARGSIFFVNYVRIKYA